MELFLILFVISVPIFYVKGIISFFTSDKSVLKKDTDRESFLQTVIKELSLLHTPSSSLQSVIARYTKELEEIQSASKRKKTHTIDIPYAYQQEQVPVYKQDVSEIWTNWYAHNSINLLLYIGALLIVSSAAIFLGFQWDTIAGVVKAGILTILTLSFFVCGIWFYQLPKIRQAGIAFMGIAALLLPINGAGWYQFVLKAMGANLGIVWLFTSLIALIVYILFAHFLHAKLYTYIAGLSTLSLTFSLVRIAQLDQTFYVLASILSCFILFLSSLSIKKALQDDEIYTQPLAITAHSLLPISLLYGLFQAMDKDILFSFSATLCLFLASLFYTLSYVQLRKSWHVVLIDFLLTLTLFVASKWQMVDNLATLYLLVGTSVLNVCALTFFYRKRNIEESSFLTITGITKVSILFFAALSIKADAIHLLLFSIFPIIFGRTLIFVQKRWEYFSLCASFASIALFILFNNLMHFEHSPYYLGLLYGGIGLFFYLLSLTTKSRNTEFKAYIYTTVFFLMLGTLFTLGKDVYHLLVLGISISILLSAAYFFMQKYSIYAANTLITYAVVITLRMMKLEYSYYPLVFMTLYFAYYLIHQFVIEPYKTTYRYSALHGAALVTAFFTLTSFTAYAPPDTLVFCSLVTAYGAAVLFGLDAFMRRSGEQAYISSFFALGSILWNIHYLEITALQAYTAPVGLYLVSIGYIRNRIQKKAGETLYTLGGVAFLLLPSLIESFGYEKEKYSLLLGIEGLLFIFLGISLNEKIYKTAGLAALFFAIISQTYQYVFALPRWVLVGIIGFIFLAVAIYLMQNKKDDHTS